MTQMIIDIPTKTFLAIRSMVDGVQTVEEYILALIDEDLTPKESVLCKVTGCIEPAEYEGWYRNVDFTMQATGTISKTQVCEKHKGIFIKEVP